MGVSAIAVAASLFLTVVASATDPGVTSGPLRVRVNAETLELTLTFAEHGTAVAFSPAVHLDGALHAYSAGGGGGAAPLGMQCRLSPGGVEHGADGFGKFTSLSINCTAGTSNTPVDYAIKAYYEEDRPGSLPRGDGLVIFDVALPRGGTGLRMREFVAGSSDRSPPQFAPFPAFDLDSSPALRSPVALCYGSERPHMLASKGVAEMSSQCTTLSGGMTALGWTSEHSATSIAGAVITAANEFHLSLNRLIAARPGGAGSHSESDAAGNAAGEGSGKVWSHGLSGEIDEVPAGFVGRTMLYYSGDGLNAAVDGWGTTLRQAYATEKQDNEDLFLQTVTLWTDNGAALNGEQWRTNASRPVAAHGQYQQLNFSAVDQASIGAVGDSIAATGVSARGAQMDCWW